MTRDRGAATVWAAVGCALLLLVGTVVVARTAAVAARHRAEAAADLAALAGAGRIGVGGEPCVEARRIARRNSATLRNCSTTLDPSGRSGTVTVGVAIRVTIPLVGARTVRATARAGRLPAFPPKP